LPLPVQEWSNKALINPSAAENIQSIHIRFAMFNGKSGFHNRLDSNDQTGCSGDSDGVATLTGGTPFSGLK
jgi:hypothetical protein